VPAPDFSPGERVFRPAENTPTRSRGLSALVYALGLIAAAVGLVVVIFAVVDGIEQIEDLHCLRRRMYSSKAAVTASSVVP
jgi:hypothetical protein